MDELQYIATTELFPHPDNPRRELGDLQELSDSIKANGVFQNLTVVPRDGGGYIVVIGHRRLAAAKMAGVPTVPCVVAEMSPQEQIRTMIMENVQRSDLTLYEQACGFQMMIDLGETVKSISEESGFSQTAVRNRLKIMKLDRDKVQQADKRGATLQDYLELGKIEDQKLKDDVLDAIGTPNFQNKLKTALKTEADQKRLAQWAAEIEEFAMRCEQRDTVLGEHIPMTYVTSYTIWNSNAQSVKVPEDAETARYYYTVNTDSVSVYRDSRDDPQEEEESEEKRLENERKRESERVISELEEITKRHFFLRREFVAGCRAAARAHMTEICMYAAEKIVGDGSWTRIYSDPEIVSELLGLETDETTESPELQAMVGKKAAENPAYTLLACIYADEDREEKGYWEQRWNRDVGIYQCWHEENENLDRLYALLTVLGYEMSDEEKEMRDGTHRLLTGSQSVK